MTTEISVSDSVKNLIVEISRKLKLEPVSVKYREGSQEGDGYGSKTIGVEIKSETESLNLFLKCAINNKDVKIDVDKIFATETYFYEVIYPVYRKLSKERKIKDGFRNVPKYYCSTNDSFNEIIVMENLRSTGYTLFNRHKVMNDTHLKLLMETFAKFHAVSFALKDQNKILHDELCSNCFDPNKTLRVIGFDKIVKDMVKDFYGKLDPIEDKDILDTRGNFAEEMGQAVINIPSKIDEYSILTKGDCWSNNMMILYDDDLEENPIDIMLIDWQLIRKASPIYDIMNIFYTIISKDDIEDTPHYMKVYHEELCRCIKELGSDPNICYPYEVFEKEWMSYSKYGFGLAIIIIKIMLTDFDEVPNFIGMQAGEDFENLEDFIPKLKKENEYMRRLKYIARYLIRNKLL